MKKDSLEVMFRLRKEFMSALAASHGQSPNVDALDLSEKDVQRHLRDVSLRGVEEVFESLNELKNSKSHRKTELPDVDKEKFLEEWVDAFNYFFTVLILSGFTADDLYEAYVRKDAIIHQRIKDGY